MKENNGLSRTRTECFLNSDVAVESYAEDMGRVRIKRAVYDFSIEA